MSALQLEEKIAHRQAPAPQDAPVLSPGAGKVRWAVVDGARVTGGCQNVGEVRSSYATAIIGCDHVGTLRYAVPDGTRVKLGQPLAYVIPDAPEPVKRSVSPVAVEAPHRTNGTGKAQQGQDSAVPAPSATESTPIVERRSTLPDVEALVEVEELALPAPLPKAKARPRRPRMGRRTTRPTDHQIDDFQDRAERLKALGFGVGEQDRLMYDLYLRVSDHDIIRELEAQRDREVAGRYCYGNGPQ